MGDMVFFDPKSWYKIIFSLASNAVISEISLLISEISGIELFGDGKYGIFWSKELMERWYLLGVFYLSMIFQDLGNMVFGAVKQLQELF